jgi:hypothetical protein
LLCDSSLVDRAKAEFDERMGGARYECLLPEDAVPPADLNSDIMEKYRKKD